MITETSLSVDDLVLPVFLTEEGESPEPVSSMPEIFRWPLGLLVEKTRGVEGSRDQMLCRFS